MKEIRNYFFIFSTIFLFNCGGASLSSSYEAGHLFKKWEFEKIEPYKEGSQNEEFMERIKATPIDMDFSEAKSGAFVAFFPDMDFYSSDYLISRDVKGKVSFDVREKVIVAKFSEIESDYLKEIKALRIIHLEEGSMAFEIGDSKGNLYHLYMK